MELDDRAQLGHQLWRTGKMDPVGHLGYLGSGRISSLLVSLVPVLSWVAILALSSFSKEAILLKFDYLLGMKLA